MIHVYYSEIVVRYKGPAAQKTFLLSHGEETMDSNTFAAYESLRSIFALTNQNTAPPVTTDSENIWRFELVNDDTIKAKLRIASYPCRLCLEHEKVHLRGDFISIVKFPKHYNWRLTSRKRKYKILKLQICSIVCIVPTFPC